jgi:hypothetical protein
VKPLVFLRVASVLTLIHALLHTIGGVYGSPEPGPQLAAVTAMKANQFLLMGHTRSYWNFYMGMGLGISISLTMEALVFWVLSSIARHDSWRVRPIYPVFAAGYLVFAVNSYEHFFLAPVIVEILIALCLTSAFFTSRPVAVRV